ncbi:hypothetical protein BJ912DRAFT_1012556 [Pholiota molesta]|nr:hypothetical protein BJ912DRAFT_1012556 [Pholiota molesta]
MILTPETCLSCEMTFPLVRYRKSHCRNHKHATVAFICEPCKVHFPSSKELASHTLSCPHDSSPTTPAAIVDGRDDSATIAQIAESFSEMSMTLDNSEYTAYCQDCNLWLKSAEAMDAHLQNKKKHAWCFTCSRDLGTSNGLLQHKDSVVHLARDHACPFCDAKFKCASSVAHHIESGTHKITRHHVTAAIHAMDIVPNITLNRITGPPTSTTAEAATTYIATEASFNGRSYECAVPECAQTFATLRALDLHLNSAAHDEDAFKCPKCNVQFKVVSGFIQHLESRSCGLAKMPQIEGYFTDLTGQFSRLLRI